MVIRFSVPDFHQAEPPPRGWIKVANGLGLGNDGAGPRVRRLPASRRPVRLQQLWSAVEGDAGHNVRDPVPRRCVFLVLAGPGRDAQDRRIYVRAHVADRRIRHDLLEIEAHAEGCSPQWGITLALWLTAVLMAIVMGYSVVRQLTG